MYLFPFMCLDDREGSEKNRGMCPNFILYKGNRKESISLYGHLAFLSISTCDLYIYIYLKKLQRIYSSLDSSMNYLYISYDSTKLLQAELVLIVSIIFEFFFSSFKNDHFFLNININDLVLADNV